MVATTADKQAWLKRILRKSVTNGIALKTQLGTDLDAAVDGVATGEIQAIAGNGLSTTFAGSSTSFKPTEVVRLLNELDNRYDAAKAALIARGTASPTDSEIFDEIMLLLVPIRRMMSDFTDIRCS